MFNLFKSSKDSAPEATWNPDTVTMTTMQQPTSPQAPTTERVVTEQPSSQEQMNMTLRGGGAGGVCCGVCAGLMCFECCEECC
ncbi:uncharacterized protein BO97DRAFT_403912 [Aspergillus homomorphus CBS 101889]|uniref:Cysteine-rich transmembrane CYSTM domain-containing protein n=1 Tax=Aspergillus homomorphus (strain CBS 101889) TaxID=1450537 RepID=A0A395I5Z5_ASPHC|nr:hypothetical protein BO97DRAFT_403912 [Aspergillus homomorphus CBS 101889]RAL14873.1 hypothetical protein BO97DRAFT_403912 [Aspergillus homomorphus CBS 101889]